MTDDEFAARPGRPVDRPALGSRRPDAGWPPRSTSARGAARRWRSGRSRARIASASRAAPAATSPTSTRASWSRPCPITEAGEIVLIRRGIEPGLGSWAQPGGFLEVDETVNQAAIRETWEETGLLVEPGEIVGLYTRLEAAVVTIAFEARIVGGTAAPTPRRPRSSPIRPRPSRGPGIAFKTTLWALATGSIRRRPGLSSQPPTQLRSMKTFFVSV